MHFHTYSRIIQDILKKEWHLNRLCGKKSTDYKNTETENTRHKKGGFPLY